MRLFQIAAALFLAVAAIGPAHAASGDNTLTIQLKDGPVVVELMPDVAPKHVAQIKELASKGEYDNVAFHRVIEGFMAQTGDVEFGDMEDGFNAGRAGTGGSKLPDLPASSPGSLNAVSWAWPARRIRTPPIRSSSSCSPTIRR
jgi:peptidyl-prolyl cis-trans isomerase A (cyclophilin A)